jgi:hypothetical protein
MRENYILMVLLDRTLIKRMRLYIIREIAIVIHNKIFIHIIDI